MLIVQRVDCIILVIHPDLNAIHEGQLVDASRYAFGSTHASELSQVLRGIWQICPLQGI